MLWRSFWDYVPQAIQEDVCLYQGFLCESRSKSGKGAKVGGITSGSPDPSSCTLGSVPIIPSPASLSFQPTPPPLSASDPSVFFPHLHPKLQWSEMEHSNYSLVLLKIANNSVCMCVCVRVCVCVWGGSADGPFFCVSPAIATRPCCWAFPLLLLQTFCFINIKDNRPGPVLLISFCLLCVTW